MRFFVFDVLHVDGADVSAWRYADRRALLEQLQFNRPNVLAVPPMWTGVDPQTMLDVCREHALEGIVSKRLDSAYRAGRSPDWVKTPLRRSAEVVVVGWVPGAGPNSASVGSLPVAGHTPDGQAVLVGQVGTGLTSRHRATLSAVLRRIERKTPPVSARLCPIVGTPRWVTPKYVGTVEYREFGDGGLRHSSWKGLRELAAELVSLPERA